MEDETLTVSNHEYHTCLQCRFIIAPKEALITTCPYCSSQNLGETLTSGLFLNIDAGRMSEFENRDFDVLSKEGRNRVKSAMLTMPLTMSVSKHRVHGVILDEFGVNPNFKLDRKRTFKFTIRCP